MPDKVLIIGAGAAGCAAAWSLSRYPDSFEVHVWEAADEPGGVATTRHWDGYWFNDGVQGGAPTYRNTINWHRQLGFDPRPVHMTINFGKGPTWWNNYGAELETELVRRLRPEIRRFGQLMRHVHRYPALYALVPIRTLLWLRGFSSEFANLMALPLTALFFGTGNQTPRVPSLVVAQVFTDDKLRLFEYDPDRLLSSQPQMFSFDNLHAIYSRALQSPHLHAVHLGRAAQRVQPLPNRVLVTDTAGVRESFDQVILACDADTALQLLGRQATWMQRQALGNVRYYRDVTVTHTDLEYMRKHYEIDMEERADMYFVRTDPQDPARIDMSFALSSYQPQLRDTSGKRLPLFQTIFLDERERHRWTIEEIRSDHTVLRRWWKQMSHEWKHFAFAVPFMRYAQGGRYNNVWFAGSWTLMNLHEVAVVSGLAAAEMCARYAVRDAEVAAAGMYPFAEDADAKRFYDMVTRVVYGRRARQVNKRT